MQNMRYYSTTEIEIAELARKTLEENNTRYFFDRGIGTQFKMIDTRIFVGAIIDIADAYQKAKEEFTKTGFTKESIEDCLLS